MTSSLCKELIDCLRSRLAVIGDLELRERDPQAQLQKLQAVSERIESLGRELPADSDPQLLHYFQRCSYDKALAWLEAHTAESTTVGLERSL